MLWNPSIPTQAIAEVNKEVQKQLERRTEVNVVLTSSTALLYVTKLLSILTNQEIAKYINQSAGSMVMSCPPVAK